MSSALKHDTSSDLEGSNFTVKLDDENIVEIELVQVKDPSNEQIDEFVLLFMANPDVHFDSMTHILFHNSIGNFKMFLGPVEHQRNDANCFDRSLDI